MSSPNSRRPSILTIAAGTVAAFGALALANNVAARRAEARYPPYGRRIVVDGIALHVMEFGPAEPVHAGGPPIVLLHGNLVAGGDWLASGVVGRLAAERRVVVFDRPGFGHSERPRGARGDARAQATLLREACRRMNVVRPVVMGHSWATLVALAWALDAPEGMSGLGLLGGYFYPTPRLDVALVAPAAAPIVGDVLRHTVSPPLARITLSATLKGMFAPRPVPAGYREAMPPGLVCRPGQLGATAEEGAAMRREAASLIGRVEQLRVPLAVMAGAEDLVVDAVEQSVRLADHVRRHADVPVDLWIERGAGHMVHHAAPDRTAAMAVWLGDAKRDPGRSTA
ncbi:alpha/beta hydrolase [uncultured Jannaschia sp.]|uniref:alpha/beta fold hydrolase n=1 Tax=uncultured Jannaschia sp. TaxID=293347 RepID=UPI00261ADE82|nr:alpha/beta hydrolase [uncultured Jannaschia sp.]